MQDYRKEYNKNYYIKNIERIKNYYNENKEEIIKKQLQYYQKNKFEINKKKQIYFSQYYQKHKEQIILRVQKHYYNGSARKTDKPITKNEIIKNNIVISLMD